MSRGTKVWFNGKIVPTESVRVGLFTHALHYGTGAFEGIRMYQMTRGGSAIFRLKEHIDRLFDSFKILGLKIPATHDEISKGCVETCRENGFNECYLRPIAFVGDGPLGLRLDDSAPVDVAVLAWIWGRYLGDEGVERGVRLKTSSFIRPQVNSSLTKAKITGQYVTGVMAKREAIQQGFQEALLLDSDGYVAEGAGENIFIVRDGKVKTTPLTSVLPGITRRTVIEHLDRKATSVSEVRFTRDEIWCADEAFLTGTAAEITPIRELDNRAIGNGKPGPLTQKLQKDFQSIVRGELPEYRDWLTMI